MLRADAGEDARQVEVPVRDVDGERTGQIVVAMARDPADLGPIAANGDWRRLEPEMGRRPWTDDYSNILEALVDKGQP
jgi:hypothetical protein